MQKLINQIQLFENFISESNQLNTNVSKAPVGWHIEHSLLVVNAILENITKSNPDKYQQQFKFGKFFIFLTKTLPRGKAKAPSIVTPERADAEKIHQSLKIARLNIDNIPHIKEFQYINHPYFGHLRLAKAISFLKIHNQHHLKIIKDILKL